MGQPSLIIFAMTFTILVAIACGPLGDDVVAPALLELEPAVLNIGTDEDSKSLLVKNAGSDSMTFEVKVSATSGPIEWLKVEPVSGAVVGGGASSLMVTVLNRDSLEPRTYNGTITVVPDGLEPKECQVTLEVGQPILFVEPGDKLDFGSDESELNLTVKNTGAGKLQYTIVPPGTWISTDAVLQKEITANEPQSIKFVVDRAAVPWYGDKSVVLMITSNGLNDGNHSNTNPLEVRVFIDPACEVDGNCSKEGFYCEDPAEEGIGECKQKKELGQSCSRPGQCKSQICSDGVCCDVACEGQCISCVLSESLGTCSPELKGTTCNDNLICTVDDRCEDGECRPGEEMDCAELKSDCSTGYCDEEKGGCISAIDKDTCKINDICHEAGEPNPDVKCQMCVPEEAQDTWSITPGACLIDEECYAMEDPVGAEGCEICNPLKPDAASQAADGAICDDDGNECTEDLCNDGLCAHDNNDENACSDGDDCTLDDTCTSGVCQGTPYSCDDGLECTKDNCDGNSGCLNKVKDGFCAVDGECWLVGTPDPNSFGCASCQPTENNLAFTPYGDGINCSDSNPCTLGDKCQSGGCVGQLKSCDDGIMCTQDTCAPSTGECGAATMEEWCLIDGKCHAADDHATGPDAGCLVCSPLETQDAWTPTAENQDCDDLSACSEESKCVQGICTAVGPLCDDEVTCTDDACDDGNVCEHPVAAGFCLIENVCVGEGALMAGGSGCLVCAPGEKTTDWSFAGPETVCDDDVKCTADDHCSQGLCIGVQKACDDGLLCTDDSCNEGTGECENTRMAEWCIIDDECRPAGGGPAGKDAYCKKCDPDINPGEWLPDHQGQTCDDLSGCSDKSICDNGACVAEGLLCDDANECTVDTCTEELNCQHANAQDNLVCGTDAIGCTEDICLSGACQHPVSTGKCLIDNTCYSDGDVPLASICSACDSDFPTQWTSVNQWAQCSDGEWCTTDDICVDGVCTGVLRDCGGDQCHIAACLEDQDKCLVQTEVDGTGCDDNDPCSVADQCLGGECKSTPKDCSALTEGNDCIQAFCDPGSDPVPGECKTLLAGLGASCEDGLYCTQNDECNSEGQCLSGEARDCDVFGKCHYGTCDDDLDQCVDYKHSDDVACNTDDDGCTVNDSCFDGVCTPGAQANCSNQSDQCNLGVCESLSEQNYQCVKEPVGQGDNCDDENYCTINDACNDTGDCLGGGPRDCSALTSIENCTVGLCSEAQSKCYAATAPDGATCNDGEPCTLADTCVSGQCKGQMDGCEQRQLNGTYQGGDAPGSWFLPRATNIGNGNILVLWRTSAESLRARVVDRDMSLSTEIIDITNGASFPKDQDDGCYNGISRADIAVAPNGNWLIAYSYRYGLIESINNHPYYYSTVMMFRVMFSAFNANLDQQKAWSELWLGGAPGYQEHQTKPACSWLQEGGYSYPDDFITVLAFPDSSFGVLEKIYYDHQPVMWPIAANFSYDKYTFKKLPSNATKYKRPSAAVLGNGKVPIVWNTPNEIANKGLVGIGVYDFTAENWAIGTGAANMSADPGHQAYPVVAALPDNRYATAFSSLSFGGPGKLYLQYFNSNGTADGSALQPTTGNDTGVAAGPEVLDNGSMVMTWWRNGADGNEDGIEACIYSANLNKTVQPFVVNDETAGIQKFPVPVADGNEWVVVWATQYPAVGGWPAQPTYDYYLKRYNQAGKPVAGAPERRAAENLTGDQDNAEAAATDSGAVMVWESDSVDNDSTGISMRILDADGAPMTSETMVNVTTGNAQTQPSVTFSSAVNRIGVAWTSYGQVDSNDVMFRLFGSNGSPVTSELMANQTTGGDQAAPSVTAVSNGDFVVAWSGYSNDLDLTDIYARAFSSDGQALGNEFIINSTLSGDQTNPTVLRYGNSSSAFVAAWVKIGGSGSNGIYVRRFNKDGSPESAEALVAQVSSPDSYNVDRHNTTGIGAICWQKNGVWCRVLGTQLTPQGNAFSVGDNSPGNPSVVVRGTNEFWVTYDRVGVDSGGRAIVREIVDSSGNTLGFPILVNWHEAGNQMIPFSVLLDNNDLLVGWRSTSQDGSGEGVFYRFLD